MTKIWTVWMKYKNYDKDTKLWPKYLDMKTITNISTKMWLKYEEYNKKYKKSYWNMKNIFKELKMWQ